MADRIISNKPASTPIASSASRQLTNAVDVARTWPEATLDPDVLTQEEQDNGLIVQQLRASAVEIQFTPEPDAVAVGIGAKPYKFNVAVTDGDGNIVLVSDIASVQVDIDAGSATGKKLGLSAGSLGAVDASIIVPLVNGQGSAYADVGTTGTIVLGLTDVAGSGLLVDDTKTFTVS